MAWLTVLLFVPSALPLNTGQISPLLAAGIALFLWALDRRRDLLAGIFLLPLSTKPQAIYLFMYLVGLWIFQAKRYRVLYGFAISLGFCVLACIAINPAVFKFFLYGLRSDYGPYIWQTPTLTALLSTLFPEHDTSLRYLLPCIGVVVTSVLWLSWRTQLKWQHHLIPVLLLSLLTTTYGWTFDLVLLLPLAVIMTVRFNREPRKQFPWFTGLVAVQVVMLAVMFSVKNYFVLFWVAPVLAMLYWLSNHSLSIEVPESEKAAS